MTAFLKLPSGATHKMDFSDTALLQADHLFHTQGTHDKAHCCKHCCHPREATCPIILMLSPISRFLRDTRPYERVELILTDEKSDRTVRYEQQAQGAVLQLLPLLLKHSGCVCLDYDSVDFLRSPDEVPENWMAGLMVRQFAKYAFKNGERLELKDAMRCIHDQHQRLLNALEHVLDWLYSTPDSDVFINAVGAGCMILRFQMEDAEVFLGKLLKIPKNAACC